MGGTKGNWAMGQRGTLTASPSRDYFDLTDLFFTTWYEITTMTGHRALACRLSVCILGTLLLAGCDSGSTKKPAQNVPPDQPQSIAPPKPSAPAEKPAEKPAEPPKNETTATEPLKFVPTSFQLSDDGPKYTIPAPEGATLKGAYDGMHINGGPRFNVIVKKKKVDLKNCHQDFVHSVDSKIISLTDDSLIVLDNDPTDMLSLKPTYKFATNVKVGDDDLFICATNVTGANGFTHYSEADCKAALEAVHKVAVE